MRRVEWMAVGMAGATGLAVMAACGDDPTPSGGESPDASASSIDGSAAGPDAAVSDAAQPTSDGSSPVDAAPAYCSVLDAGFDASAIDASALVCPAGQWRDLAASTCKACPSAKLTCQDLLRGAVDAGALGSPRWSKPVGQPQRIETTLADGRAQIVSATATLVVGSCFQASETGTNTVGIPVSVEGNTLVSTFPAQPVPGNLATLTPCGTLTYTLVDACCGSHVVSMRLVTDQESTGTILARSCP